MGHPHDHEGHAHEGHSHQGHSHAVDEGGGNIRALTVVLVLTTTFLVAEIVGGLLTGSLALLADAGHMASDSASIGLALFAFWLSSKPATPNRSFGYKRAEILAALANGVSLVVISIWIFVEAIRRFQDPPEILGGPLLVIAVLGLFINLTGAAILMRSGGESLNLQGALRHVLADLAGSVGVIVAAGIILLTGWVYADPLIRASTSVKTNPLAGCRLLGRSGGTRLAFAHVARPPPTVFRKEGHDALPIRRLRVVTHPCHFGRGRGHIPLGDLPAARGVGGGRLCP